MNYKFYIVYHHGTWKLFSKENEMLTCLDMKIAPHFGIDANTEEEALRINSVFTDNQRLTIALCAARVRGFTR